MRSRTAASLIILGLLLFSGCQSGAGVPAEPTLPAATEPAAATAPADTNPPAAPPAGASTPDRSDRLTPAAPSGDPGALPEKAPTTESLPPVVANIDGDILNPILVELARSQGVTPGEIKVVQAQALTYSDGSLGCPQPGKIYTQSLVDGYWIVLEVGGKTFDYRAAQTGHYFLCEDGAAPKPAGTPAQ